MRKIYWLTFLLIFTVLFEGKSQTIYSEPTPLQLSSEEVKIFFNAKGTPLEGLQPSDKVYAHTGWGTGWNSAPSWGTNVDKYLLTYVSENLWQLYIGDLRTYYNIPMSTNHVDVLNFVFRNANCDKQTADLKLNVYEEGLQIDLTSNAKTIITPETAYVKFTVSVSQQADITLAVNGETIASAANTNKLEKEYLFPAEGDYSVTAIAEAGDESAKASMELCYLTDAVQAEYPGGVPKMGPVANADGSVTFCLGAIDKKNVLLVGSWNDYAYSNSQMMNYQDTENGRYFWTTVTGLEPNSMYAYFFIIDGGEYMVGDPYARLVLDPYNDKSLDTDVFTLQLPEYPTDAVNGQNVPVAIYQGTINDYDWKVEKFKGPDHFNLMIYELLFRDFTGTEGEAKGNGTVQMAIEKIPYLKTLGVNAIELLPIMEFNGNNSWGYNPNFYFAVDKAYGTPDDYKEFIDICHQNGMAVILDMVFNQSDGLHPWFQMYEPGKNPYYNQDAPHAYSVLNDWNQGTPMVQQQWADVIRYWMTEYKFDGFRFDLVKGLGLNESYPNNSDNATNQYNASRVKEMLYLQSVVQEVNPDAYFINENLAFAPEENEMADTSLEIYGNMQMNWANVNFAGQQFAKGQATNSDMNRFYAPLDSRTLGSTVSYLESHDEQRLAYAQNQEGQTGVRGNEEVSMLRLGAAAAQMIMAPGAHMIWQFSELGNSQNTKNNNGGNNTDPKIVNWELLNDPYHKGLYDTYCELIAIRNKNPEMFAKDVEFTSNCGISNWQRGRSLIAKKGDQEILTLINPNVSDDIIMAVTFANKDNAAYKVLSKSYGTPDPSINTATGRVSVPANSYVVIGSVGLSSSGIDDVADGHEKEGHHIYGGYGEIVVEGNSGIATVYATDGKELGRISGNGRLQVASGIYIVKTEKDAVRLVVK